MRRAVFGLLLAAGAGVGYFRLREPVSHPLPHRAAPSAEEIAPEPYRPAVVPPKEPERRATVADVRKREEDLRARLESMEPDEVARRLCDPQPPAIAELLLRRLDAGLASDREAWERALLLAVESSGDDPERLARIARIARERIVDSREDFERYVAKRAPRRPGSVREE